MPTPDGTKQLHEGPTDLYYLTPVSLPIALQSSFPWRLVPEIFRDSFSDCQPCWSLNVIAHPSSTLTLLPEGQGLCQIHRSWSFCLRNTRMLFPMGRNNNISLSNTDEQRVPFELLFPVWIQMFSVAPVGKMLPVRKSLLSVTIQCYLVKGSLNVCKVTEIKYSLGKLRKSRMSASPFIQVKGWMIFPVILIRASLSVKTEWWLQHLQWNAEADAGDRECRQHFIPEEIQVWESGNLFPQNAWVSSLNCWVFLSFHLHRQNCGLRHNATSLFFP